MDNKENKRSFFELYSKTTDGLYKLLNALCVVCLFTELISVMIMVTGRFIFNKVPLWCDQLSLMALVWMAMLSITLGVCKESHMRVELIDNILPAKGILVLRLIANVLVLIFSFFMITEGAALVKLTWKVKLSGFRVTKALMYIPLVICGVVSVYMCIFNIYKKIREAIVCR